LDEFYQNSEVSGNTERDAGFSGPIWIGTKHRSDPIRPESIAIRRGLKILLSNGHLSCSFSLYPKAYVRLREYWRKGIWHYILWQARF
jgi:hypothetical protein